VYVGSLLILMGSRGHLELLVLGGLLAFIACAMGVTLALGRWPGRPRPATFWWAIVGVAAFYGLCAVIAGLQDTAYIIPTLAAGIIPMTAVALLLALMRSKTEERDGRLVDRSVDDETDSLPGFGIDDGSALGDTTEHASAGRTSARPGRQRRPPSHR
jgi:hypothetical protein